MVLRKFGVRFCRCVFGLHWRSSSKHSFFNSVLKRFFRVFLLPFQGHSQKFERIEMKIFQVNSINYEQDFLLFTLLRKSRRNPKCFQLNNKMKPRQRCSNSILMFTLKIQPCKMIYFFVPGTVLKKLFFCSNSPLHQY